MPPGLNTEPPLSVNKLSSESGYTATTATRQGRVLRTFHVICLTGWSSMWPPTLLIYTVRIVRLLLAVSGSSSVTASISTGRGRPLHSAGVEAYCLLEKNREGENHAIFSRNLDEKLERRLNIFPQTMYLLCTYSTGLI